MVSLAKFCQVNVCSGALRSNHECLKVIGTVCCESLKSRRVGVRRGSLRKVLVLFGSWGKMGWGKLMYGRFSLVVFCSGSYGTSCFAIVRFDMAVEASWV